MSIEAPQQLDGLLRIGRIVGLTIRHMAEAVTPGMTTAELDAIGADYLAQHGARSAPQIAVNYPAVTCISINEEAAHGLPGSRLIQKGDLVKIDVSAERDGYFADAAVTVGVPPVSLAQQQLIDCARRTLDAALGAARAGQPLNHIGQAADRQARRCGFRIIQDLTGHGTGLALWEEPTVPNHYIKRFNQRLHDGLVLAVEPHLTAGRGQTRAARNGWTLTTVDRTPAANFEHTIIVTDGPPVLVTAV